MKSTLAIGSSSRLAASTDGKLLAVLAGGAAGKVSVWNISTGKRLYSIRPLSYLARMEFSPCSRMLALKNTCGHIVIVDACSGKTVCDFKNAGEPGVSDGTHPLFSGCGRFLVDGTGRELRVHNATTGRVVFEKSFIASGELVHSIVRLSGGERWLMAHVWKYDESKVDTPEEGEDYVSEWTWPFEQGSPRRLAFADSNGLRSITGTDHGRYLAMQVYDTVNLHVHSLENLEEVFSCSVPTLEKLHWSADGKFLAVAGGDEIVIYAADNFEVVVRRQVKDVDDMAFSPRGDYIAVGARKGYVLPWSEFFSESRS